MNDSELIRELKSEDFRKGVEIAWKKLVLDPLKEQNEINQAR